MVHPTKRPTRRRQGLEDDPDRCRNTARLPRDNLRGAYSLRHRRSTILQWPPPAADRRGNRLTGARQLEHAVRCRSAAGAYHCGSEIGAEPVLGVFTLPVAPGRPYARFDIKTELQSAGEIAVAEECLPRSPGVVGLELPYELHNLARFGFG